MEGKRRERENVPAQIFLKLGPDLHDSSMYMYMYALQMHSIIFWSIKTYSNKSLCTYMQLCHTLHAIF